MLISIGKASEMLGVSITTLRRWERIKKFMSATRTFGGHRRYKLDEIYSFMNSDFNIKGIKKAVAYARVSSHDQKEDLKRQIVRLKRYCNQHFSNYEIMDDLGSGLNFKKKV